MPAALCPPRACTPPGQQTAYTTRASCARGSRAHTQYHVREQCIHCQSRRQWVVRSGAQRVRQQIWQARARAAGRRPPQRSGFAHGESSANLKSTADASWPSLQVPSNQSPLGRYTAPRPCRLPCARARGGPPPPPPAAADDDTCLKPLALVLVPVRSANESALALTLQPHTPASVTTPSRLSARANTRTRSSTHSPC